MALCVRRRVTDRLLIVLTVIAQDEYELVEWDSHPAHEYAPSFFEDGSALCLAAAPEDNE